MISNRLIVLSKEGLHFVGHVKSRFISQQIFHLVCGKDAPFSELFQDGGSPFAIIQPRIVTILLPNQPCILFIQIRLCSQNTQITIQEHLTHRFILFVILPRTLMLNRVNNNATSPPPRRTTTCTRSTCASSTTRSACTRATSRRCSTWTTRRRASSSCRALTTRRSGSGSRPSPSRYRSIIPSACSGSSQCCGQRTTHTYSPAPTTPTCACGARRPTRGLRKATRG